MDALEFYKSHESAPLPDVGDLVSLTVEELCELMEQYHQSKVNNVVLGDVIKCECENSPIYREFDTGKALCYDCEKEL